MSAFGRDLVGNVNCGTANPLMQMAGQMTGMNAQLADVRSFGGADKLGRPVMTQADLIRQTPTVPQTQGAEAFMQGFQPQMQRNPMPLQLQQQRMQQMQQQRMNPPLQKQHVGPDMADQFMQMELQAKEFEHAYQAGIPAPSMWAQEFGQQHPQQMRPQPHMMQPQQHRMQASYGAPYGGDMMMRHRMMGGGMGGFMGMQGMMNMQPQYMPPMSSSSSVASSTATVTEIPADQTEEVEEDNLYSDGILNSGSLEDAYKIATGGQDWSQDYIPQQDQQQGPGLAGGMDKDMIHKLMHSDNPKWRNSKFLKFIDKISKGEIEFRDNQAFEKPAGSGSVNKDAEWANEFGSSSAMTGSEWADEFSIQQNHPASWSDQFAAQSASQGSDFHMAEEKSQAERFLDEYAASDEADTEFKDFDWQAALAKAKEDMPVRQDPTYDFTQDNPYQNSQQDTFSEGVKLFHEGKIKEAILAFEATVQKQPDHADAWAFLGEAQAQNEEENNAIAAFLQCVAIDPYNLKALLQLGVSYTNDLEEHRALNYLKTWMQNNPDYQGAALSQQKQDLNQYMQFYGSDNSNSQYSYDNMLHDEVTKMFLNALSIRPDDPDLHTVLGVLYHISSDFDKAIEAFKNAVKLKPDDAALWNKLGATQANSSRSSDAVHAYKRALQLRPAYVRTLANLAISYANQGLHEDAVRTYLTTLAHNPDANHVWSYLRISLSNLQRDELVELSHQKNVELFRPFFQF